MPALREPTVSLAARYRPSQSPPRTLLTPGFSSVVQVDDKDSSVEIVGPSPIGVVPSKSKLAPVTLRPSKFVNVQERILTDSVPATEKQVYDKKSADANKAPALPIYSYLDYPPVPVMVYTSHEEEANDLVQTLKGPVGFDMEWRVLFYAKAPERPTALIQVCDKSIILLIHVSSMQRFPEKLRELIESKDIAKIGVNILSLKIDDGRKLFRDFGILANNLVELSTLAKQADPEFDKTFGLNRSLVSLAKVVANYCGKTLPKGKERTGNWEGKLGPNMLAYAANDAHCALTAYRKLLAMATDHKRTLYPSGYTSAVTFTVLEYNAPPASQPTATAKTAPPRTPFMRQQHLRAYSLWYRDKLPLERICAKLRSEEEPLKESTVISYVVGALDNNASLPFEMTKLIALVRMEAGSWRRHREFIMKMEREGRGSTTRSVKH